MAIAALVVFAMFMLVVAGLRTWIHLRRTGDTGDRRQAARRNPVQRWIDLLASIGALAVGVASPVASLAGMNAVLESAPVQITGLILAVLGTAGAFTAQLAMGESWRVGVDPDERTALVTSGVFKLVRNPILACAILTCVGLTLMVPTPISLAGLVAVVVANQLLVRLIEEPHLSRVHGEDYLRYASAVGRFVPGIGRYK